MQEKQIYAAINRFNEISGKFNELSEVVTNNAKAAHYNDTQFSEALAEMSMGLAILIRVLTEKKIVSETDMEEMSKRLTEDLNRELEENVPEEKVSDTPEAPSSPYPTEAIIFGQG